MRRGKKRSFQVCLFADKGKQWTVADAARTGWVGSWEGEVDRAHLAMAERGGIFWQRGKARSAALPPRDILEPFKEAAACILGIHFASIKHANCEGGEEERNVSHAFIQPLMMPLLSKMLEGRGRHNCEERDHLKCSQTVWPDRSE